MPRPPQGCLVYILYLLDPTPTGWTLQYSYNINLVNNIGGPSDHECFVKIFSPPPPPFAPATHFSFTCGTDGRFRHVSETGTCPSEAAYINSRLGTTLECGNGHGVASDNCAADVATLMAYNSGLSFQNCFGRGLRLYGGRSACLSTYLSIFNHLFVPYPPPSPPSPPSLPPPSPPPPWPPYDLSQPFSFTCGGDGRFMHEDINGDGCKVEAATINAVLGTSTYCHSHGLKSNDCVNDAIIFENLNIGLLFTNSKCWGGGFRLYQVDTNDVDHGSAINACNNVYKSIFNNMLVPDSPPSTPPSPPSAPPPPPHTYTSYGNEACGGRNELPTMDNPPPTVDECIDNCNNIPTCVSFEYYPDVRCQFSTSCNETYKQSFTGITLYVKNPLYSPPPPSSPPSPPSIPNYMMELTGCPESHEVLADLRLTVSDTSLTQDEVIEQIRDSIHTNINNNTALSISKHNIVVSASVQSGINRPPVPPRPPSSPPVPFPPPPPPAGIWRLAIADENCDTVCDRESGYECDDALASYVLEQTDTDSEIQTLVYQQFGLTCPLVYARQYAGIPAFRNYLEVCYKWGPHPPGSEAIPTSQPYANFCSVPPTYNNLRRICFCSPSCPPGYSADPRDISSGSLRVVVADDVDACANVCDTEPIYGTTPCAMFEASDSHNSCRMYAADGGLTGVQASWFQTCIKVV